MSSCSKMQLLAREGTASRKDSKTVTALAFEVPEGTGMLSLFFDYAPRTTQDRAHNTSLVEAALTEHNRARTEADAYTCLEVQRKDFASQYREIHNLMNVVLIDPSGRWRGRWDRNPASADGALVLSEQHASQGFQRGALQPGRWIAAIECHGIFGSEPVRWTLRVDASDNAPSKKSGAWYFGELHSHTVHSDGAHEPLELIERARRTGLDFLALTDHNTMSAIGDLDPALLPPILVPGCELTTFFGHYPIYGVRELVPWHATGRVRALEEIARDVRAQGGLISVAHPFKVGDPLCTGCRMPDGVDPKNLDLMEVWYRRWGAVESDNTRAYALWNRYWSEGQRVTAVAARDWHGPSQEKSFPGELPLTGVYARAPTAQGILEGIRAGRVIMSGGPIIDLRLDKKGGLSVEIARLDAKAELRIHKNGERVLTSVAAAENFIHPLDTARVKGPGWYRAELWSDGAPRAIGNHVVVESTDGSRT